MIRVSGAEEGMMPKEPSRLAVVALLFLDMGTWVSLTYEVPRGDLANLEAVSQAESLRRRVPRHLNILYELSCFDWSFG
jgi:hypothetical protein